MPLHQASQPTRRSAAKRTGGSEKLKCPKCQRPMTLKQVTPLLFTASMDEMVYGCEDCGTKTKRTMKRA
jgi:hypothetical protein